MTIDEMIAVLQGAKDGKMIQCNAGFGWEDTRCPGWNFDTVNYRIKPEPREVWHAVYSWGIGNTGFNTRASLERHVNLEGSNARAGLFREVLP